LDSLLQYVTTGEEKMSKNILVLISIIPFLALAEGYRDDISIQDRPNAVVYTNGGYQTVGSIKANAAKELAKQQAAADEAAQKSYDAEWSEYSQRLAKAQMDYDNWKKDQPNISYKREELQKLRDQQAEDRGELAGLRHQLAMAKRNRVRMPIEDMKRLTALDADYTRRTRAIKSLATEIQNDANYPAKVTDYKETLPGSLGAEVAALGPKPTARVKPTQVAAIKTRPTGVPIDLAGENCRSYVMERPKVESPSVWGAGGGNAAARIISNAQNTPDQVVTCQFPPDSSRNRRLEKKGSHFFEVLSNGTGYMIHPVPELDATGHKTGVVACQSAGYPCKYGVSENVKLAMTETFPNEELALRQDRKSRNPRSPEGSELLFVRAWMDKTGAQPLNPSMGLASHVRTVLPDVGIQHEAQPAATPGPVDDARPMAPVAGGL
jgi:hypothetical protein